MKKTKKLTICAMMSALSVVILYLASLFNAIDLSVSLLASFIILITVMELGVKCALSVYISSSFLSLLLLPQKYIAVMYLLFCGIYPIIRVYFEKLPKLLRIIIKFVYFAGTLSLVLVFSKYVFRIEVYSGLMLVIFYVICIVAFALADVLISRISRLYFVYLRKRMGLDKLFG